VELTIFGPLKSSVGGFHVFRSYTFRTTNRGADTGVHTIYGTGHSIHSLVANDERVLKILIFYLLRQSKIFKRQWETRGNFKKRDQF
jgi:hypothetical protein